MRKQITNTKKIMILLRLLNLLNYLTYLDMNNLYGWAMGEYLPYGGFKWLKNVDKFNVNSISKKRETGYFLEVNLEYPDELHELHNDYTLGPEKLAVSGDMLSKYYKEIADKYGINVGGVKKINSEFRQQNQICASS